MTLHGLSPYLQTHPILTLLLITHFLSDYHLQSQKMADLKEVDKTYLIYHIIGIAIPLALLTILIPSIWLASLIIVISHSFIDFMKPVISQKAKLRKEWLFIIDQVLHLFIIALVASQFTQINCPDWLNPQFLLILLFLLIISKPCNIIFKIFFSKYQPELQGRMDTINGAGATIGILERIIIGICMVMGQYASIGLVFTAKSIARYNKISENPAFAEYYLIGSLFSILSVFVASWICFF